jgi:hypothetical protein
MFTLDLPQLADQPIVPGIRYFWRVQDVIEAVVSFDFTPQSFDMSCQIGVGGCHHYLRLMRPTTYLAGS